MAHSPGSPYPLPGESGDDAPDLTSTDAYLPDSDGLPDGADVWHPPDGTPPDQPSYGSSQSSSLDTWPDGIPPGTPGQRRWWRDAVDRAIAAQNQPREIPREIWRSPTDEPSWLTPTPFTPTPQPAPAFGTLLCALCTDGIWRPELVRLQRTEVFLGIVNGAPHRFERRQRIPCCETCWNRLNFVRMEVERGRLSDWPGGVFHHFKAVMPPVYDVDDLLRHHRDDDAPGAPGGAGGAGAGDTTSGGPDGAWGWRR